MNVNPKTVLAAIAWTATSLFAGDGVVSKNSDALQIGGDLRIRHENRKRDYSNPTGNDDSRNRLRTRFRLSMDFTTTQAWSIHAGLATGGGDGTSTNDTWNEDYVWETGGINLDYAYAKNSLDEATTVLIGQQKNPFVDSGIFWDGDLRPTGFTAQRKLGSAFLTGGYHNLAYYGDSGLGEMLSLQAGYKHKGDLAFSFALGYYAPNTKFAEEVFGNNTRYQFEFVNLYGDLSFKAGDASIKVFAEAGKNLGADDNAAGAGGDTLIAAEAPVDYTAKDNNTYFTIGAKAKHAKLNFKAQYAWIEGDSVLGYVNGSGDMAGLNNSDFGTGIGVDDLNSDVKGVILGVSYKLSENSSIGITFMDYEAIERRPAKDGMLTQIDFKYKF